MDRLLIRDLRRILADIEAAYPGLHDILMHRERFSPDDFARAGSGLFRYLREDESTLQGKTYTEISKVHMQLIKYLADPNWRDNPQLE